MKLIYKAIIAISIFIGSNNNSIAQVRELSLKEAYAIALKGNRQLLISRIEELKANAIVTETRSLLSPNVSATGNYSLYAEQPVIFLRNENSAKVVQETRVGGRNNFSAAILASYPILNPLAKSKVRAAGINERLQSRKTEEIESDIAFEIGQQYLITLLYKEQLSLLNQSLERNERALKDSRSLFLQGKSLKTDTLQNFIAVQNLNASISALENRIKVQVLQLKQLLALDEHEHVMLSDSLHLEVNYALLQGEESLEKVALENRNDLKIQMLRMDIGREQMEGVKAEFKPNLNAVAAYQLQAQSDKFNFWKYNMPGTSFVGIQLNVPIYSGKRKQSKLSQQQFNKQQDEIMMDDLKQRVKTELHSIGNKLEDAYNQNRIQQQNVQAAGISYKMIKDRYQYGMSSRLELADAELALTEAKIDALTSVYNINLLKLQLEKVVGLLRLK